MTNYAVTVFSGNASAGMRNTSSSSASIFVDSTGGDYTVEVTPSNVCGMGQPATTGK